MTVENYQELSMRTFKKLNSEFEEVSHMVLGLISEQNELSDALAVEDETNIKEELGDKLWYLSNLANIFCVKLDINFEPSEKNRVLSRIYSDLADKLKRRYVYGTKDDTYIVYDINCIFRAIIDIIVFLYGQDMEILENIMNNNISKLMIRYPEKYSDELALNRKLGEELKQLKN